jgi:hypothetical protein
MRWIFRTLFLVKEIKSKSGELHFQRWRIFWTPWFAIYIHRILRSDEDLHPHSHPWKFISLILFGGYNEELYIGQLDQVSIVPRIIFTKTINFYQPLSLIKRDQKSFHHITLVKPTTTLVLTYGKRIDWGYLVDGKFVEHKEYRKNKNVYN